MKTQTHTRVSRTAALWICAILFGVAAAKGDTWIDRRASSYVGGDGSAGNPFQVATAEQLAFLAYSANADSNYTTGKCFVLTANIHLAGHDWVPISPFKGNFDGRDHAVFNLTINNSGANYQGLFGDANSGATILNIGVQDCNIIGNYYNGALAGYANNVTITRCHSTGSLNGYSSNGGLVGEATTSLAISNSWSSCSVIARAVDDYARCGSLVGPAWNCTTTIRNCSGSGPVGNGQNSGGLVALTWGGSLTMENCYNAGTVTTVKTYWNNVGGILGLCNGATTISNGYHSGRVIGSDGVGKTGGIVGGREGGASYSIANSYYNSANAAGQGGGTAMTTNDMKLPAFVVTLNAAQNPAPWTADTNNINNGFPILAATPTLQPSNTAPVAVTDMASTMEDTSVVINVLTNDTDADMDALTISAKTDGTNGTVAITGGGTNVTYTPATNWNGSDSFTYTVSDGNGGVATGAVNVTVNAVNDPPVASNDTAVTAEDTAVVINVLTNDTDVDGDALSVTAKTDGTNGTVAITGGGTNVTYTPVENWNGSDSFTYTVSDGNGGLATGTVNVTVNAVNDPPVASNDTAVTAEDTAVVINVLTNDTDVDGGALTITAKTDGTNGTVAITGGGTNVTYTPAANWNGNDSFTYTVSDGNGGIATGTVNVAVDAVNDPPFADNDSAATPEDTAVVINVLTNDTDVDADALTITAKTDGTNGTVVITGESFTVRPSGGTNVTYTPAANWHGSDSFTYTVSDGNGGLATGTVNVIVSAVNDPPVAANDSASTLENNAVVINVLANDTDVDGGALSITAKTDGAHGTAAITGGGRNVTYTPAANWHGSDSFTYTVSDGNGGRAIGTVNVTVELSGILDYDGDGVSDLAVYAATGGAWYINYSSGGTAKIFWGFVGSATVPGDYDGDGLSDLSIFDKARGRWYIRTVAGTVLARNFNWGWPGATPVVGDYDGDGKDDLAVFDENTGCWHIYSLAKWQVLAWNVNWGWREAEPVSGDYNGDGKSDLAVLDPNIGCWYIYSLDGRALAWKFDWGCAGAQYLPGDFDGDGASDLAAYVPNTCKWYIYSLKRKQALAWGVYWGLAGATPVSGDYNGDGITDLALYHQAAGKWYIRTLAGNVLAWAKNWGWSATTPVKP